MNTAPATTVVKAIPEIVVLDTCVLISSVLRGILLRLADQACFQPAWSEVIGDEWRRNVGRVWGVDPALIQAEWDALQRAYPQADQGDISSFKGGLIHSDPKDWHVVAAARAVLAKQARATVAVVTRNMKDFRRSELNRLGIDLLDPDQLLVRCWMHHRAELKTILDQVMEERVAAGRPIEPLPDLLKRERLFRLNKICDASE